MNCRIPRIIEFLNASCARGFCRGHVCLSVHGVPLILLGWALGWPMRGPSIGLSPKGKCPARLKSMSVLEIGRDVARRCSALRKWADDIMDVNSTRRSLPSRKDSEKTGLPSSRGSFSRLGPQIRQDHPLSLSISLSGGKETNEDFLSNGERTGSSPA